MLTRPVSGSAERMDGCESLLRAVGCSYYTVAPTRGHKVPEETPEGFEGVLGRDAWKPYDVVKCEGHQLDLLHVNRWLERAEIKHRIEPRTLLPSKSAKLTKPKRPPKQFIDFADGIRSILKRAIEYTESDPPPYREERKNACKEFYKEMKAFLDRKWTDDDAVRISEGTPKATGHVIHVHGPRGRAMAQQLRRTSYPPRGTPSQD